MTFDVTNDGTTTHNLEIEGNGIEEATDDLDAGAKGELTVDLKPGTYEIYCSIDGHKDLGMEGDAHRPVTARADRPRRRTSR